MTLVFVRHNSGSDPFRILSPVYPRGHGKSTAVIAEQHERRMQRLDALLSNMRVSFADIERLGADAAARGQARAKLLQPFEKSPAYPKVKATVARVAGQDIRRFIPRRSM